MASRMLAWKKVGLNVSLHHTSLVTRFGTDEGSSRWVNSPVRHPRGGAHVAQSGENVRWLSIAGKTGASTAVDS